MTLPPHPSAPPPDDLPVDAHLRTALRHAPDHDALPPAALSAQILAAAARAVQPPQAAPRRPWYRRAGTALTTGLDTLQRPAVAAAFASLVLGTALVITWRDTPLPGAALESPGPAEAPAPQQEAALPAADAAAQAAADAPADTAPPAAPAPQQPPKSPEARAPQAETRERAAEPVAAARRLRQESAAQKPSAEAMHAPATEPLRETLVAAPVMPSPSPTPTPAPAPSPAPARSPAPETAPAATAAPPPTHDTRAAESTAPPAAAARAAARSPSPSLQPAVAKALPPADPLGSAFLPATTGASADSARAFSAAIAPPAPAWLGDLRAATRGAWAPAPGGAEPAREVRGQQGQLLGRIGLVGTEVRWQSAADSVVWRATLPDAAAARLARQLGAGGSIGNGHGIADGGPGSAPARADPAASRTAP